MSSAHHPLLVPADTPVHRLAPQCKVAAATLFVLVVASTPAGAYRPYLGYLLPLAGLAALARLGPLILVRRLLVEVPFLLFVLALPVLGGPPHWKGLSVPGLHAAAAIALKATFGLLTTAILAATTPLPEIITGLERLRVPPVFTAVAAFMVRYTEVLAAELTRTRTAALCRGGNPRWLWQVRDVTAGLGTLLVRSFERAERVYLAMVSRGYTGVQQCAQQCSPPTALSGAATSWVAWASALAVPTLAALGRVLGS